MLERLLARPEFAGLPVVGHLDELGQFPARLVVQAPPGTGKTTAIPPAIADRVSGRVIVTQPRRIAARAAARRLQALTGTRPGEYAAHTVRGESTLTDATKIEFVTTGVLLRRLIRDPELAGIDAIILDEIHERHLDADLAFAMVSELSELRDGLTVCAMSATLDAARWATLLRDARIVEVPSALHPLDIEWASPASPPLGIRGVTDEFLDHVADVTKRALARHNEGSALVFVPGAREVDAVVWRLSLDVPVLPLHGRLSAAQQDAALADTGRRVVVSTVVAESSLTVPGVRIVVDAGLSREPRFDANRGVSGLVTVRESKASATQRAGRAARLGPGLAVRCWAEEDWAGMADESTPEVLVADLSDALLTLACWGSPRGEGMALPTPLPATAVERGEALLRAQKLIDDDGLVTALGREVARLPLDPSLGAALLAGTDEYEPEGVAGIVAMLSDDPSGNLDALWVQTSSARPKRWQHEARRLARMTRGRGQGVPSVGEIVARAKPGWIARRRGDEYLTASGTGLAAPKDATIPDEWIAVWDSQRVGDRTLIRAWARLDEAAALAIGGVGTHAEATFTDRVRMRAVRRLGAITLGVTNAAVDPAMGERAVREALSASLDVLEWGEAAQNLRRRLALLRQTLGEPWPAVDDASLMVRLDEWLGPEIGELARGASVRSLDLVSALRRLLPWPEASRLDELVPERLEVPSGSRIRLQYEDDGRVICAVKLQECFGLTATPTICDGRVSVLMHLLSPAGRPLAVTEDLASFWAGPYAQVRAENRGRYAKHPWPEDPLAATPTRHTKRRAESGR